MLFKRGNGVAKAKGMFIMEKVEMFLEMCIMEPLLAIVGRPKTVFASLGGVGKKRTAMIKKDGAGKGLIEEERHDVTVIERRTLRRLLPNPLAILKNLFKTMELQEPTFKEVVLCIAWPNRWRTVRLAPAESDPSSSSPSTTFPWRTWR